MKRIYLVLLIVFYQFIVFFNCVGQISKKDSTGISKSKLSFWAYDLIQLPELKNHSNTEPIIIAVIDDGFRLSHKEIRDFVYLNNIEIKNNFTDDDGNGYRDDFSGWDVSDNNNNVYPPQGRENRYFHGTFICGIITTILKKCYGNEASKIFKILPVKAISDYSENTLILDGYKGIEYAISLNADIICCAWSGGIPGKDEKAIIEKARKNRIAVIGSSGNYYTKKTNAPASLPGVLAVGAIDTLLRKTKQSNYGMRIDLVAPGEKIKAAYPIADNAYFYGGGTSGAAAIVTGCVAILKAIAPNNTVREIYDALINTADPVDSINASFCGKLGAGIPNLKKAVAFIENPEKRNYYFNSKRTKGKLYFNQRIKNTEWAINPFGSYKGFVFSLNNQQKKGKSNQTLAFYSLDSLQYKFSFEEFPKKIFVPGSQVNIHYSTPKAFRNHLFELEYSAITIDSTLIYCRDTRYFEIPEAEFSDGSSKELYANNCSCKWLITAPLGKRIRIEFLEFNTQAKVDYVYLFDGKSSIPENIIAKFSGPKIPPKVTSRTNQVLVWFVTDKTVTANGWKLKYSFVD